MASMLYGQIEQHSTLLRRKDMPEDIHLNFMHQRKSAYMSVKWTKDVWDEELTRRLDRDHPLPQEVRATFDAVKPTLANAGIIAPILLRRAEDKKQDFRQYMHEHWNNSEDKNDRT